MVVTDKIETIQLSEQIFLLVNLLSGSVLKVNKETIDCVRHKKVDQIEVKDCKTFDRLVSGKFLFASPEEESAYYNTLCRVINEKEEREAPNFTLLLTYACNLNCGYCYEKETKHPIVHASIQQQEAMKQFIEHESEGYDPSKIRIAITGGEPLLLERKEMVADLLDFTKVHGFATHIVTNGVDLNSFAHTISEKGVQSVQVTIDGPRALHDKRRPFHNMHGSFDKVIDGIAACIDRRINTFIRVNVDKMNINSIDQLGRYLIARFEHSELLHPYLYLMKDEGCMDDLTIEEGEAVEQILGESNKEGVKYFDLSFHGKNFIKGALGLAKFIPFTRFCSAPRQQFVLTPGGNIYKCWFGVGNPHFEIGKYYPAIELNKPAISKWRQRSTINIAKCQTCKYALICGGGCANFALRKGDKLLKPNCANFEKLLNVGFRYYIKSIKNRNSTSLEKR